MMKIEWINVKDALPENYRNVLFAWHWDDDKPLQYGAGEYFDNEFYSDCGDLANGPYNSVEFWAYIDNVPPGTPE